MAKTLNEQAEEILRIAETSGVQSNFLFITKDGAALTSYTADVDTDEAFTPDTEVVSDGYFHESEYRSAPYFDVQIDGITLLNAAY